MTSSNTRRVAKNTIILYIRSLVGLIVGIVTVRYVLQELGERDYGIYSVVGSILAFITFISAALYVGNQRFFSYYIGKGDETGLRKIFGVSLSIYLILSLSILIFGETIGVWYINTYLNINPDRLFAANVVFQLSMLSSAISVLGVPYSSAIMAHEDMHIFGWIAIYEAVVKIIICYLLIISPWDKLIFYSAILTISTLLSTSIYVVYSRRKYKECRSGFSWDKSTVKELTSFNLWNFCGSFGWVAKNQGLSIILNWFFGPLVNAAQGIAMTVRNYSSIFSNNFCNAVAPQIVKNYAINDHAALNTLLIGSSKMSFFLMLIVVVPLFFCMDFILQLWVGDHTAYMNVFCKIILIEALIDSISYPMASANQATGKIATYQTLIGLFALLTLPAAYLLLRLGLSPVWAFIVSLISQLFVVGVRIFFIGKIYPYAVRKTLKYVVMPCLSVGVCAFAICWALQLDIKSVAYCILGLMIYCSLTLVLIWFLGLSAAEKKAAKEFIAAKLPCRKKRMT